MTAVLRWCAVPQPMLWSSVYSQGSNMCSQPLLLLPLSWLLLPPSPRPSQGVGTGWTSPAMCAISPQETNVTLLNTRSLCTASRTQPLPAQGTGHTSSLSAVPLHFHQLTLLSYISFNRSWCRRPFSTYFDWQQHTRACLWKCSDCNMPPFKFNRDIDRHIAWHAAQQAKLSAIESELRT